MLLFETFNDLTPEKVRNMSDDELLKIDRQLDRAILYKKIALGVVLFLIFLIGYLDSL